MPNPVDLPAGKEMIDGLARHPRTQSVSGREEPVLLRRQIPQDTLSHHGRQYTPDTGGNLTPLSLRGESKLPLVCHNLANPCSTTSLTLEPSGGAKSPESQWSWDFPAASAGNDPVAGRRRQP